MDYNALPMEVTVSGALPFLLGCAALLVWLTSTLIKRRPSDLLLGIAVIFAFGSALSAGMQSSDGTYVQNMPGNFSLAVVDSKAATPPSRTAFGD